MKKATEDIPCPRFPHRPPERGEPSDEILPRINKDSRGGCVVGHTADPDPVWARVEQHPQPLVDTQQDHVPAPACLGHRTQWMVEARVGEEVLLQDGGLGVGVRGFDEAFHDAGGFACGILHGRGGVNTSSRRQM